MSKNKSKKIAVLYHAYCPDGFGGAYSAWKKFGKKAEYLPVAHQSPLPKNLEGKEVYIIDFSYSKEVLEKVSKEAKLLVVIDHHISAEADIKSVTNHVFDINHSGSVLAWRYFHKDKPTPKLLQYVENTDIWKFKLPYSREIMSIIKINDFDFEDWDKIAKELEDEKKIRKYVEKGKIFLEQWNRIVEEFSKMAEEVDFEGYKILAVNAPSIFKSDVGHFLAIKHSPFAIVWYYQRGHFNFSLRSDGTVDVSKIAQKYGGGGHKAAASFRLDLKVLFPFKKVKNK